MQNVYNNFVLKAFGFINIALNRFRLFLVGLFKFFNRLFVLIGSLKGRGGCSRSIIKTRTLARGRGTVEIKI